MNATTLASAIAQGPTLTDYQGNQARKGDRIELHPGCDLWMRGARFGTVKVIIGDVANVRMDNTRVRNLVRLTGDRFRVVA